MQATAPAAVADLAARGLGVAVLSASMAVDLADLAIMPIDGITVPVLLAVVWRDNHSPAVRELLPHLRRAFAVQRQRYGEPGLRAADQGARIDIF